MNELLALPFVTFSALGFYAVLAAMLFPWFRKAFDAYSQDKSRHSLKGFDFFRGIAAIYVALGHGHTFGQPLMNATGYACHELVYFSKGVGIFAVLSGFLIYRSVLNITNWEGLRNYFVKRFFRIYPLYLASVLLCALFSQYSNFKSTFDRGYFLDDVLMCRLFPLSQGANPVYWTLYIEVLFYLALPLIVLGLRKRRIVLFCAILLVALLFVDRGDRSLGLVKYFAFGVLAQELSPRVKQLSLPLCIGGLLLCIYDLGGPAHDLLANWHIGSRHLNYDTFTLGVGCALVAMSLPHLPTISKALDFFPLKFVGVVSYSIYLLHLIFLLAMLPSLGLLRTVSIPCSQAMQIAPFSAWYLPLVYLPGVLFWSFSFYMLVERPGILLGNYLIRKSRKSKVESSVRITREEIREPAVV